MFHSNRLNMLSLFSIPRRVCFISFSYFVYHFKNLSLILRFFTSETFYKKTRKISFRLSQKCFVTDAVNLCGGSLLTS